MPVVLGTLRPSAVKRRGETVAVDGLHAAIAGAIRRAKHGGAHAAQAFVQTACAFVGISPKGLASHRKLSNPLGGRTANITLYGYMRSLYFNS